LIEVQGQFEQRGLLDAATHRGLLDAYAGSTADAGRVAGLWHAWQDLLEAQREAQVNLETARRDEEILRHDLEELEALGPRPGEEQALADERSMLLHRENLIEAVNAATQQLTGDDQGSGAESAVASARRRLERAAEKAGGRLDPVLEALGRASAELDEALALIGSFSSDLDLDPGHLERIEERFFALKDLARKHGIGVDQLAQLKEDFAARLAALDGGTDRLAQLEQKAQTAGGAYQNAAETLSEKRGTAATALDQAVNAGLPPLKLEKAAFQTKVERLEQAHWGPRGIDRVAFEVSTNPGAAPGPLGRIASGGELSRFLLALKVVLAQVAPPVTLVFDEVDSGIGGATAHAVGARLARLAEERQVLVVTHSPQVAARGSHHLRVHKEPAGEGLATRVGLVSATERREEIARMLSGAEVTEEARAAADRLMGAA
jgi:DNA repair protein RecN (Recombination protein N)